MRTPKVTADNFSTAPSPSTCAQMQAGTMERINEQFNCYQLDILVVAACNTPPTFHTCQAGLPARVTSCWNCVC